MKVVCEGRCGCGRVRQDNQDNIFVGGEYRRDIQSREVFSVSFTGTEGIFAVCDGMGGERYGEEASFKAAAALEGVPVKRFFDRPEEYLLGMNEDICRLMRQRGAYIGTTFAGIAVRKGQCRIVNIGDSRIYLLRDGQLQKRSRDHTRVQQMVEMGILTAQEAAAHRDRHKLTQHLGIFPEEMVIEPHISQMAAQGGDLFLLCSDGLTDMLTDEEIRCLLQDGTLAEKADRLYETAMDRGGKDNISVVLTQITK